MGSARKCSAIATTWHSRRATSRLVARTTPRRCSRRRSGQRRPPRSWRALLSTIRPRHFEFLKDTDPYPARHLHPGRAAPGDRADPLAPPATHGCQDPGHPPARAARRGRHADRDDGAHPARGDRGRRVRARRRVSAILQSDYSVAGGVEHLAAAARERGPEPPSASSWITWTRTRRSWPPKSAS